MPAADFTGYSIDELLEMAEKESYPEEADVDLADAFLTFDDQAYSDAFSEAGITPAEAEIKPFSNEGITGEGFVIAELDPEQQAQLDAAAAELGNMSDYASEMEELEQKKKEADETLQGIDLEAAMEELEAARKELEAMGIDADAFLPAF